MNRVSLLYNKLTFFCVCMCICMYVCVMCVYRSTKYPSIDFLVEKIKLLSTNKYRGNKPDKNILQATNIYIYI